MKSTPFGHDQEEELTADCADKTEAKSSYPCPSVPQSVHFFAALEDF
jgi:hypothetical protein